MFASTVTLFFVASAAVPVESRIPPLTCLLTPVRQSEIGSDTGGIVASVAVSRADRVAQGDLLLQLDDRIAQSDLRKARIMLDSASERLARAEALTAGNVISKDEITAMRTEAALAAAELEHAELQVARARIVAPFAGSISAVMVEEGELIGPEPLITLIDTSRLTAELVFPTDAFGQYAKGDALQVSVDLAGGTASAVIRSIDPFIDASSNTFSVVAEIDNADGRLPAGANCRLQT